MLRAKIQLLVARSWRTYLIMLNVMLVQSTETSNLWLTWHSTAICYVGLCAFLWRKLKLLGCKYNKNTKQWYGTHISLINWTIFCCKFYWCMLWPHLQLHRIRSKNCFDKWSTTVCTCKVPHILHYLLSYPNISAPKHLPQKYEKNDICSLDQKVQKLTYWGYWECLK